MNDILIDVLNYYTCLTVFIRVIVMTSLILSFIALTTISNHETFLLDLPRIIFLEECHKCNFFSFSSFCRHVPLLVLVALSSSHLLSLFILVFSIYVYFFSSSLSLFLSLSLPLYLPLYFDKFLLSLSLHTHLSLSLYRDTLF